MAVVKSRFDAKTRSYPVTAALGEKKGMGFSIEEDSDSPRTSCKTKEMFVPLDVDICPECKVNHSAMIRAHEMAHAKWSPKNIGKKENPYNASMMMYEGLEEVRVNYLLRQSGIKDNFSVCKESVDTKMIPAIIQEPARRKKAFMMLAMLGSIEGTHFKVEFERLFNPYKWGRTPDEETLAEMPDYTLDENLMRQTMDVFDIVHTAYINMCYTKRGRHRQNVWSKSVSEYAKYLDEALEEPELPADMSNLPDELQNYMKESIEAEAERMKSKHRYAEGKSKWGRMTIEKAPLVQNLGGVLKARKSRAMDMGAVPKYMHRYTTDQKIFYRQRRVLGGTLLVDVSGSMGLNADNVMEILSLMPAATIAMYSGSGSTGRLVIIAENGKMTNQRYINQMRNYGNIVDGPALDWLGKQPGPRLWVSDGQASGAGDSFSEGLRLECFNKQVRYGIVRINDIEQAEEFAKKYRKEAS